MFNQRLIHLHFTNEAMTLEPGVSHEKFFAALGYMVWYMSIRPTDEDSIDRLTLEVKTDKELFAVYRPPLIYGSPEYKAVMEVLDKAAIVFEGHPSTLVMGGIPHGNDNYSFHT